MLLQFGRHQTHLRIHLSCIFFGDRSSAVINSAELAWYDLEIEREMNLCSGKAHQTVLLLLMVVSVAPFFFFEIGDTKINTRTCTVDVNDGNCLPPNYRLDCFPVIGKHVLLMLLHWLLFCTKSSFTEDEFCCCCCFNSDRRICFIYSHVTQKKSTSTVIFRSLSLFLFSLTSLRCTKIVLCLCVCLICS